MRNLVVALQGRCRGEEDYNLKAWERWFYTFKAVVAIICKREYRSEYGAEIVVGAYNFHKFDHYEFGASADWDELVVKYGFRHWEHSIRRAGYP